MSKVKDLPGKTTVLDDDWIYVVDDAAGTNGGRKVKKSDLETSLNFPSITHGATHKESGSDPIPNATPSEGGGGLMSASDKNKLDNIDDNATANPNAAAVPYERLDANKKDIHASSDDVEDALTDLDDNKLSIDGNNAMNADLDMNGHNIINGGSTMATDISYDRSDVSKLDIQAASDDVELALNDLDDKKLSIDGNNIMAAALDMGTNDITNVGTVDGRDVSTDGTKLDGIESGATADQTDAEIKTAYENNADTNAFTDAEQTKLTGIESGATADQTDAEIKTAYENNADTNAFTDAEQTKLTGIESGATADQTGAEIKTAYEAELNTNAYVDADQTKVGFISVTQAVNLDTIESDTATNNAKVSADGSVTTHSDVTNAGSGLIITGAERTDIGLNTTHRSSDGKDHSDVVLNNSHRIATNNPHKNGLNFIFGSDTKPYLKNKTTFYETLAMFDFEGTTAFGSPTTAYIQFTNKGGITSSIRIYDRDNALVIAEVTGLTPAVDQVFERVSMGAISNLPAGIAAFEIQILGSSDGAGEETWVGSLLIK